MRVSYQVDGIYSHDNTRKVLSLEVTGAAVAQPRHHVSRLRNRLLVFDPASSAKRILRNATKQALEEVGVSTQAAPIFGPGDKVKLTIEFYVDRSNKDMDNLLKFVMDAMSTVVYSDDRIVEVVNMEFGIVRSVPIQCIDFFSSGLPMVVLRLGECAKRHGHGSPFSGFPQIGSPSLVPLFLGFIVRSSSGFP